MLWIGLPLSFGVALLMVPAGVRGLADAGLVRENFRGRRIAYPGAPSDGKRRAPGVRKTGAGLVVQGGRLVER